MKMKPIHIIYCFSVWCIEVSSSSRFKSEESGGLQKPEINDSKYMHRVEHSFSSSTQNYRSKNIITEAFTTEMTLDVSDCRGMTAEHRKRRFIPDPVNYSTPVAVTDTSDFSILSDEFLNCILIIVEPGCYQILTNGSTYVPLYDKLFDRTNYIIKEGLLYLCPNFFDQKFGFEELHPPDVFTISIVGVSISSTCIILHMVMFFLVPKLRNIHGYCVFSLCIPLLISHLIPVLPLWHEFTAWHHPEMTWHHLVVSKNADCKVMGLSMMYSLLASFFWMNVVSFDVWYGIRLATSKLRLTASQSAKVRFFLYSCYAWGMPMLVILLAIVADHVSEDMNYKLIFSKASCWFQYKTALLLYLALPIFVLLVMNIIYLVASFLRISKSRSDSGSQDAHSLRSRLFLSLRLGSVMGLVWLFRPIFGFSMVIPAVWSCYLYYLFTILEGIFIFTSFTLNKKTQNACKQFLKRIMPCQNNHCLKP